MLCPEYNGRNFAKNFQMEAVQMECLLLYILIEIALHYVATWQ